jgi:hypothetical protein
LVTLICTGYPTGTKHLVQMRDSICTGYPTWYKCKHLYRGVLRPSTNVISVTSRLLSFPPPSPFFFSFSFLISSNSFMHACIHPSIHSFNHNTNHYTNRIYNHKFIHISLISSHSNTNKIYNHEFTRNIWTRARNIKKQHQENFSPSVSSCQHSGRPRSPVLRLSLPAPARRHLSCRGGPSRPA